MSMWQLPSNRDPGRKPWNSSKAERRKHRTKNCSLHTHAATLRWEFHAKNTERARLQNCLAVLAQSGKTCPRHWLHLCLEWLERRSTRRPHARSPSGNSLRDTGLLRPDSRMVFFCLLFRRTHMLPCVIALTPVTASVAPQTK